MMYTKLNTFYDKTKKETVVIASNQFKTITLRKKGNLLCLDKEHKMRKLQRKAVKELNK